MTKRPPSRKLKAAERRKLERAVPNLMDSIGFTTFEDGFGVGYEAATEWGCQVTVRVMMTESPWLACKFDRPYRHPDLPWNHPDNARPFADIPGANPHSGKLNCHPGFSATTTADDLLHLFRYHLETKVRPIQPTREESA